MTDAASPSNVRDLRPDESSDPVQLRPNGTVLCQIGGKRYVLRRPRMGQFRMLREAMQAMHDELEDELEATARRQLSIRRELGDLSDQRADADLSDGEQQRWHDLRTEDRRLGREAADRGDAARLRWLQLAWDTLSADGGLPTTDDGDVDPERADAWMLDPSLPATLLGHWRSTPFPSGGQ